VPLPTFDRIALVVAHPDDEILWFSSIVSRAARVVVCYLDVPGRTDWTTGRRHAATEYPLSNWTFLGLTESVVFAGADWKVPVTTEYGIEVQRRPGTLPEFDAGRYRENYHLLCARLGELLSGYDAVVTHNPWGDYGNEEHVQVYRAVTTVQKALGYDVWYTNYCSNRSYALMLRETAGFRSIYETLPTEPTVAAGIEAVYRRYGCWTWPFDDYVHFSHESFIRSGAGIGDGSGAGSTCPLNFIQVRESTQAQSTVPKWRRLARVSKQRVKTLLRVHRRSQS